jgi:protoporphyrinogen oxidase
MDPEFARRLSRIDFIGVVCGVFRLKRRVSDAFWLMIHDPGIAANGFIEYTNLNNLEDTFPDKIIYIPFYVPLEDRWFTLDERAAMNEYFRMLKIVNPGLSEEDINGFRVFQSPHAQAVCRVGFRNVVPPVESPLGKLFLLDSTQLYPSDRTLSGMVGLAKRMVDRYF